MMKRFICILIMAAAGAGLVACSSGGGSGGAVDPEKSITDINEITVTTNVSEPVLRKTLPASWDENWFASPAVCDLNADGMPEIVAGRHSVVYVWDNSGTLLWRAPVGESSSSINSHGSSRQYASPVVGDLDGDGYGEIAVSYSNQVILYDRGGSIRSGWPKAFPGPAGEIRSIASSDLDNDGRMEILAQKTGAGPVTMVWRVNGETFPGWPQIQNCPECNEYGGYNQNIGAADMDGDGFPEVVSTYDSASIGIMHRNGAPYAANAIFRGPYASSVPMFHDIALAKQGWGPDMSDRDEFTDSSPVFGDTDNDGLPELIVYSDHERAGEYIIKGNSLWALNPDMTRVFGFELPIPSGEPLYTGYENNIVQVAPSPALANLAGDTRPEIVVPSYDGLMRCFSPEGKLLWSYRFDSAGAPFIGASGAAIGDLDHDGSPEIVFTTYSTDVNTSHLLILNAKGQVLHKMSLAKRGSMSVPTLADVDADGKIEIVISLKDTLGSSLGGVQIWNVASASAGALPWPTGRGSLLRNGQPAE